MTSSSSGGATVALAKGTGGEAPRASYYTCRVANQADPPEPMDCNKYCAIPRPETGAGTGAPGKACSPTGCNGDTVLYFGIADSFEGCNKTVGGVGPDRFDYIVPKATPIHVTRGCDTIWSPPAAGAYAMCCCE